MKQSDDKFEVTLDVPQYKPEELKVTVINNILSIEGAHNEAKKGTYLCLKINQKCLMKMATIKEFYRTYNGFLGLGLLALPHQY